MLYLQVMFAAMDCTEHQDVCSKYGVSGYPTFKYISYGKNEQPYTGGREVHKLRFSCSVTRLLSQLHEFLLNILHIV